MHSSRHPHASSPSNSVHPREMIPALPAASFSYGSPPVMIGAIEIPDEDDDFDMVVMAIDVRGRGKVGCSYYVAREEKLYLMEDISLGGLEIVDLRRPCTYFSKWRSRRLAVKIHIEPTVILVSSRADESIDEHLNPTRMGESSVEEGKQSSKCR